MSLRQRLLETLSDGEFHSGEALGAALGVSRMAVWKHIRSLRELGVQLEVVRGRGYHLSASIELLDADAISAAIPPRLADRVGPLHVFDELDSTNNWLREQSHAGAPSGSVCVAEMQSAGRGRRGK